MLRAMVSLGVVVGLACATGCSATGSSSQECTSQAVSPGTQEGSAEAREALDAYLASADRVESLPTAGYELQTRTATRVIYESGSTMIAVATLGQPGDEDAVWTVQQIFTCP